MMRWLLSLLVLVACDPTQEFPERIEKLRAIGSTTDPVFPIAPSLDDGSAPSTIELSYFLLSPSSEPAPMAEAVPFTELGFRIPGVDLDQFVLQNISIDSPEALGPLHLYEVKGTFPSLPGQVFEQRSLSRLKMATPVRVRQGEEEEVILAKYLVFPDPAGEIPTTLFQVSIDSPLQDETVSNELTLKATFQGGDGERLKVGWYVSSGRLSNRRALETTWSEIASGRQAAVVTVRSLDTLRFVKAHVVVNVP